MSKNFVFKTFKCTMNYISDSFFLHDEKNISIALIPCCKVFFTITILLSLINYFFIFERYAHHCQTEMSISMVPIYL